MSPLCAVVAQPDLVEFHIPVTGLLSDSLWRSIMDRFRLNRAMPASNGSSFPMSPDW